MAAPQEFAAQFSRTLELFRDPAAKEEQKAQFRALASLLKSEGAIILAQDGRITVNGAPVNGNTLLQRLDLHSIHEITIPADPPLAELFELLRGLAEQAGEEDLATRLRGSARRIGVTMHSFSFDAPAPVGRTDVPGPPPPAAADEVPEIVRESVAGHAAFSPAAAASQSHHQIIAQLQEKPDGPAVGDLLAVLGRQLETAMKGRRVNLALDIVAGIVRAEAQVGDATRRRQYSIALKRMYNKGLLEAVAEVASHPSDREASLLVLRRAGEDGVEVLLDLLVAAPTVEERRGIFVALTGMEEGTDQLLAIVGDPQGVVVRKAVALALAKFGSSAAAEPLRRALRDKSPEVRIQAAIGVGGRKAAPLAMPLVAAMEEEKDEAVERELMLALGRIGSAAAVQALIKFAQPGGRLFGRKSAGLRTTAVEALRLAATPAAVGTLEGLTDDGDKHVRAAAQGALGDLKKK